MTPQPKKQVPTQPKRAGSAAATSKAAKADAKSTAKAASKSGKGGTGAEDAKPKDVADQVEKVDAEVTAPEADVAADAPADEPMADLKEKFKAALDAKSARQHMSAQSGDPAGVRADGKAVGGRRTFRRRAGGS